jgi:Rieske Fe-S protein
MTPDAPLVPRAAREPLDTERTTVPPDGRPLAEQPRWRQDFPIDWPQDEYVSRRDLVKFVALTSLAFTAGQFWLVVESLLRGPSGASLPAVAVARVDELPIGGAKVFAYPEGSTPRLLVRTGEQSFVAYDQQCTHLLCPIVPARRAEMSTASTGGGLQLHCPCHNGWFDIATGQPLAGPPRRPLARVTLEVRGGVVYATGVEQPMAS